MTRNSSSDLAPNPSIGRLPKISTLRDRDEELESLDRLLERGIAEGAVGLIEGEAGIGKTTLLNELRARANQRGATVLAASGSEQETGHAFGVVRALLEEPLTKLPPTAREHVTSGAARLAVVALSEPSGPAVDLLQASHGVYWLCANLAAETPLVLSVDDAHWCDEESLHCLTYVARRIEGTRILLVVGARPVDPRSPVHELRAARDVATITPRPLGPSGAAAVIEAVHGTAPDADFLQAALGASGGNPFLLEEISTTLSRDGVPPTREAVDALSQLAPEGVRDQLLLRVRQLPPAALALASAVSVLGDGCLPADAAAVAGQDAELIVEAERELRRAGIFAPSPDLRFRHPVLRTTVYAQLLTTERTLAHARAAQVLSARDAPNEAVASQLLHTEPRGDAVAAGTLAAAGRSALDRGATSSAVRLLERALAEPPAAEQRVDVLRLLGVAQLRTGQPGAEARLRQVLELMTDAEQRIEVTRDVAMALLTSGQRVAAFHLLSDAMESHPMEDRETELRLLADVCSIGFISAETAPRAAEMVLGVAPQLTGASSGERVLLALLAFLQSTSGAPASGAQTAELAIADGQLVEDQIPDGPALYMALDVLVDAERLELFDRVIDRALVDAQIRGSLLGFATASTFRAQGHWYRGAVTETAADAASGFEAARQAWRIGVPLAAGYLIHALTERGDLEVAEAILVQSGLHEEVDTGTNFAGLLLFHRGLLRVASGKVEQGLADLMVELAWEESFGRRAHGLQTRAFLAPLLTARGERERALEMAEAEWEVVRDDEAPRWPGVGLRGLALARGGDEAIDLLRASVDLLSRSAARLEHARSLFELGAALRRSNHRREAREPLREAMDGAHRCGALVLQARAREELQAAGGRPRRAVLSGLEALTPSERRIARMAAQGMSNPQIAQALFVTRKTVEMHLGRAYGKLGIGSREHLPLELRQETASGS